MGRLQSHAGVVRALQEWLRAQGNVDLRVDGKLGPLTAAAVKDDGTPIASLLYKEAKERLPRVVPRALPRTDPALEAKVRDECLRQDVAFEPVKAIIGHESNWNHRASSGTGAEGLMQLTSWPVKQWNLDHPSGRQYSLVDRFDIDVNIRIGVWYLTYCASQMRVSARSDAPGDWALIYGAYNLGPGAMRLLRSGRVDHEAVVKAWAGQSSFLKQGGVKRYISNAQSLFA